jgi:hypothetical protein
LDLSIAGNPALTPDEVHPSGKCRVGPYVLSSRLDRIRKQTLAVATWEDYSFKQKEIAMAEKSVLTGN